MPTAAAEAASPKVAAVFAAARALLRPPPDLAVSRWAERHRRLSRKDSARPGRWRTEPHQRAIMDAFSDPAVRRVVVKAASQLPGKSQMMSNVIGRFVDVDPSNMMVLHPTVAAAKRWSVGRLDPLIAETPALAGRFLPRKGRDGGSTILHRQFAGGQMFIVGVNAPTDLSAQAVRILLADEVDRYPASSGEEGDPLELGEQRTETYGDFAKVGLFSSPSLEGLSRIDAAYEESDRQVWELACPHCAERFAPLWGHVRWESTPAGRALPDTAAIVCPSCGVRWSEGDRLRAIEAGGYRARAAFDGTRGFHVNALGCLRADLPRLVRRWEKAQGNVHRLKAFVNLALAECWQERGEAPEWQRLYERREDWPADELPEGVLFLTGFCDVQRDRLEARVWGWGRDKQSWHVETRVMPGDPATPEPWAALDRLLADTWCHAGGAHLKLARFGIDSGFAAQEVYAWARRHPASLVMVTKGDVRGNGAALGVPRPGEVSRRGKAARAGVRVWPVNPDPLKAQFYGQLRLDAPVEGRPHPPGYVHLSRRAGDDEIRQLTAERLVRTTRRGGFPRLEWRLVPDRRNEALDCRVGAHACAIAFGLDRFTARHWDAMEDALLPGGEAPPARTAAARPAAPARARPLPLSLPRAVGSGDPFLD